MYTVYNGVNPLVKYSASDEKYTYFIYAGNKMVAEEKDGVVISSCGPVDSDSRLDYTCGAILLENCDYPLLTLTDWLLVKYK